MDGSMALSPKIDTKNGHDRRTKFVELAQNRTMNAIKAIRVIGKLGNRSHYEFDDADVKKIVAALTKEVEALRARMTQNGKGEVDFKL